MIERPETKVKANQIWTDTVSGAIYKVCSVKKAWKGHSKLGRWFMEVTALTFDAAQLQDGEGPNGNFDGEKCHVVWMDEWKFVEQFQR